jgi:flagellar protein FliL
MVHPLPYLGALATPHTSVIPVGTRMEKQNEASPTGSGKGGKILAVLLLLVGLAVGGGSGALVASVLQSGSPGGTKAASTAHPDSLHDDEDEFEEEAPRKSVVRPVYLVEDLVLNPAGSQGTRFLMASIALEVRDEAAVAQLRERDPQIRDRLLAVLGSKTVSELVAPDSARAALRVELRDSTARLFPRGTVHRVYLPKFVVQ